MSDRRTSPTDGPAGLRERRRTRTRLLVQSEALRLFTEKGYDQTTVDDIAHAAAMSPRTFFRYFPSKEDVVLWDEYDDQSLSELWGATSGTDPLARVTSTIRNTVADLYHQDPERFLARAKLSLRVPAIRARFLDSQLRTIGPYFEELLKLVGPGQDDLHLRVNLAALVAAVIVAVERWQHNDGRDDLIQLLDRSIEALAAGMSGLQSSLDDALTHSADHQQP